MDVIVDGKIFTTCKSGFVTKLPVSYCLEVKAGMLITHGGTNLSEYEQDDIARGMG